jgi:hypothetical protein
VSHSTGAQHFERAERALGAARLRGPASRGPDAPMAGTVAHGDVSKGELAAVAGGLALIAALLLGDHVLHGGLYTDDWPIAAVQAHHGTSGLISNLFLGDHARPVAALYLGVATGLTGADGGAHAALGLGLHVVKCWSLYWLLRMLAMTWWQAGAIGLLVLLFPYADSTWLWFAVTHSNIAITLVLLGFVAHLYGLRAEGRRAYLLHGTGALLFGLSVLTYEVGAAVVLLSLLLYLRRVPRRLALRLWAIDAAVVAAAVGIPRIPGLLPGTVPHETLSLDEQLDHARSIADQAFSLVTSAAVPFGAPHRNIVVPVLALIGGAAIVAWWRADRGSALAAELQRWLGWAAVGVLVIIASYVVFVPASEVWYQPTAYGSDNRINAFPAIGFCVFLFSLAMLAGSLLMQRFGRWGAFAFASLATLFLATGYADKARDDIGDWDRAAEMQRSQLARLSGSLPKPRPFTTIFAFGGAGRSAPGVWAFGVTWDLNGAVQILWEDETLHAYPIFTGTTIVCERNSLYPDGWGNGNGPAQRARYGQALFFDMRDGTRLLVRNRRDCVRAQQQFQPGPIDI